MGQASGEGRFRWKDLSCPSHFQQQDEQLWPKGVQRPSFRKLDICGKLIHPTNMRGLYQLWAGPPCPSPGLPQTRTRDRTFSPLSASQTDSHSFLWELLVGSVCVNCSVVLTFCDPMAWGPTRLLCLWDFPGKTAGVGCHSLLQGSQPRDQTRVSHTAGRLFTYWATREDSRTHELRGKSLTLCSLPWRGRFGWKDGGQWAGREGGSDWMTLAGTEGRKEQWVPWRREQGYWGCCSRTKSRCEWMENEGHVWVLEEDIKSAPVDSGCVLDQ